MRHRRSQDRGPHPRVVAIARASRGECLAAARDRSGVAQRDRDLETEHEASASPASRTSVLRRAGNPLPAARPPRSRLSRTLGSGSFESGQQPTPGRGPPDRPESRSPARASWALRRGDKARKSAIARGRVDARAAAGPCRAASRWASRARRPVPPCRAGPAGESAAACDRSDKRGRCALPRCRPAGPAASPSRPESIRDAR